MIKRKEGMKKRMTPKYTIVVNSQMKYMKSGIFEKYIIWELLEYEECKRDQYMKKHRRYDDQIAYSRKRKEKIK